MSEGFLVLILLEPMCSLTINVISVIFEEKNVRKFKTHTNIEELFGPKSLDTDNES